MTFKKSDKWYEAMKNHTPWNKGKHHSPEVIAKLKSAWTPERKKKQVESMTGRKLSESHRKNLSLAKLGKYGEQTNHWKGGVSPSDKLEREMFRRLIQKQVFQRDDFTCQMCGERGKKLQVDHIQPWAEYVEGRFDINNCRTLCMSCHYEVTFGRQMPNTVKSWGNKTKELRV